LKRAKVVVRGRIEIDFSLLGGLAGISKNQQDWEKLEKFGSYGKVRRK
jgi:hypothetical protein